MPQQFKNLANPENSPPHHAEEIWNDTGGNIDFFVAASAPAAPSPGSARC